MTLLVAVEGKVKLPKIGSTFELKQVREGGGGGKGREEGWVLQLRGGVSQQVDPVISTAHCTSTSRLIWAGGKVMDCG